MTAKNVIGYARVSTRDQAESGASLASQRQKIEAYATMHNLDLIEIIEDGGYSAKSLDRPGMARLLKLIHRKAIDGGGGRQAGPDHPLGS